ncbi:HCLS1-associated protein X-1 isoform X3 [Emydura macquarii macquarii]|uniref:HCLS1-associated protein X-1 isoform X3 n=1 Tax=Emydura macquarii macquarii TaxID=1129001 RepID=UPI00352B0FED
MNLSELFRGFLGIPRGRRPRDPFFGGITRDEEDEDDEGPSRGARPPEDFGVGLGGMRFHRSFEELFCDVGQLLGQLEAWARPGQPVELPGPEAPRPGSGHLSEEEKRPALRDSMLKYPDSRRPRISPEGPDPGKELGDGAGLATPDRRPFAGLGEMQPASASPKEDKDLDSQVSSEGLETILRPGEPRARSYFQSVSVTTVMGPDGTMEERRTVQDSQGHRETVVTRRRGDQTFVTTTKEGREGKDCREEEISLDNGDLVPFAGDWQQPGGLRTPDLDDPFSFLQTFLRGWFSSR